MSYVAEPYLHVTDQLLTGLTGGVAREAHRFFVGANAFSFAFGAHKVIPETVQVIGQANATFVAFTPRRDFVVDGDGMLRFQAKPDNKTEPATDAVWPDEGSEFFVSYYHIESGQALLTDRNVGSLTRTVAEAFARELAVLRKQLELVYKSAFVDTAEDSDLDMMVALLGVARKSRDFATGRVRFFRDAPAPADIFIPEGTRVSTALNPAVSFTTTADRTLRRGQLAVEADIRAEARGASGVVLGKTITVVNQPILGISGVVNDAPTVFGGAGESDVELRARAKQAIERAGKATPHAMMTALTAIGGLKENDIKIVEELQLRPGVVQVFVARKPEPTLAQAVQDAILYSRAAGIRVEHNLAIALPVAPGDSLPTDEARDEGVSDDLPEGEDFTVSLLCDVTVFPDNPRLTGPEQDALKQAVLQAVLAYIDASAIGGVVVYNRLVADVMTIPGVLDVTLVLQAIGEESGKGKRNLDMPEGRRAVLEEKDVTVRLAGAPINFDFHLFITRLGGSSLADIQKEVKEKLVDVFAANPTTITAAELMTKLGVSDRFTLQPADLTWVVEYDQAGLVIREEGGGEATTVVPTGDRPLLRDVRVEEKV